ncbi:MAG TPA: bifunctional riboflavin kinase/FAD synthetase [Nitrospira sp.]|nr:bifunctional riboflavin kinase/FAD synthetase [Nitrospira sp.]
MTFTVTRGLGDVRSRRHPVVTIGNFDGHHRGHRSLLQTVVARAREVSGTAMVVTFDPHPVRVLAPDVQLRFLTSSEEKIERFKAAGIEEVIFLEFTPALAVMTPDQFAEVVLHRHLGVAELYVGEHFAFGRGRAGRIADLERLGASLGFAVHPVRPVVLNGGVVSSTRIRTLIQAGDMLQAAALLGRAYGLTGTVVSGAQQGQALGWPTANLRIPPERVTPPDGVYAARASYDGRRYDAVAYIGTRPTFGAGERLIEVNVLDHRDNLYGKTMAVEFVERLRGDHAFTSAQELAAQIARDVDRAKASLRCHPEQAFQP